MPKIDLQTQTTLPADVMLGALAGRVWRPDVNGPSVVAIRPEGVVDISRLFPTMRDLCEDSDPANALRAASGENLGKLETILANTSADQQNPDKPWFAWRFWGGGETEKRNYIANWR